MVDFTGGVASPHVSSGLRPTLLVGTTSVVEPPPFDLETLFILQKGNLAVLHEAQALLADAMQAIARAQNVYLEQLLRDASPVAAVGRGVGVTRDVIGLAAEAYQRIGALLWRGARLNLDG